MNLLMKGIKGYLNMIKIMALDTSTRSTGWAVFNNEHYVRSGLINLIKSSLPAPDRIELMSRNILDLLSKEKPDIIICEQVSVSRNMKTVRELCRILDICYSYALSNKCKFYEITPAEWRGAIGMQRRTGDRFTYKQMAITFAQNEFSIKEPMDDEADAVCIGAAYINEYISLDKYRFEIKE